MVSHEEVSHGVQWTTERRAAQQGEDGVESGRAWESGPMTVEASRWLGLSHPDATPRAPSSARRTIVNRFDPPKRLPESPRRAPPAADRDRYGRYRYVVRSLPQGVAVVLPERVPKAVESSANGLDVGSCRVSSVLGMLGQSSPRFTEWRAQPSGDT
jgi:hypothetical protein